MPLEGVGLLWRQGAAVRPAHVHPKARGRRRVDRGGAGGRPVRRVAAERGKVIRRGAELAGAGVHVQVDAGGALVRLPVGGAGRGRPGPLKLDNSFDLESPRMATLSPWTTIFPPDTLLSEAASSASLALVIEPSFGVTLLNPAPLPLKLAAVSLPVTVKSPPIVAAPPTVRAPWIDNGPLNLASPTTSNLAPGSPVPMPMFPLLSISIRCVVAAAPAFVSKAN